MRDKVQDSGGEPLVFAPGAGERWALAICTGLIAILAAFLMAVFVGVAVGSPLIALVFLLPSAGVMIGLVWLIAGEMLAAFRLRIAVGADRLSLKLPRRRGHVMLPRVDTEISLASIGAIERRGEVFRQLGVAAIQDAYRLTLKDGSEILLGADRQMKPPLIGEAAAAIAARLKIAVADLGMVDGAPGVLAVVGTSVPEWSAPSLPREEIEKRVSASARAYKIMAVSATLFMLIRLIARR